MEKLVKTSSVKPEVVKKWYGMMGLMQQFLDACSMGTHFVESEEKRGVWSPAMEDDGTHVKVDMGLLATMLLRMANGGLGKTADDAAPRLMGARSCAAGVTTCCDVRRAVAAGCCALRLRARARYGARRRGCADKRKPRFVPVAVPMCPRAARWRTARAPAIRCSWPARSTAM